MAKAIDRYKFVKANGGISYVGINHTDKEYTTNYWVDNGGWETSHMVRLKDIREMEQKAIDLGYAKVDRLSR